MDAKMLKLEEEEEDRISDLPDSIVQHIISLLPSTREAIRTGILSKRWKNQWARVPVLIFDSRSSGMSSDDESGKNFLRLIDNALHLYHSSKIKKLQLSYEMHKDPDFASKLRFATRRNVEQLILYCYFKGFDSYMLPKFLIDNSSLVELKINYCCFNLDWSINWPSLKRLEIVGWGSPSRPLIGKLVSGCPVLESLILRNSDERGMNGDDDVIVSTSLKTLILTEVQIYYHMEISCPNLVELEISRDPSSDFRDEMVEISCPNLKWVNLCGSNFKLVNCPSLVYANLEFEIHTYDEDEDGENVGKQNLLQVQHVKELTLSSWFIKILSGLEMEGGLSYPMLNHKILTLHGPDFEHLPDTVYALRSSPMLERLIIRLLYQLPAMYEPRWDLNDAGENYWNSNVTDFSGLVPRLKFVEVFGLSKPVMDFIEFVLKNARVLEKLTVVISKDDGTDFGFNVSQKMLSFPRCSPYAVVELSMW